MEIQEVEIFIRPDGEVSYEVRGAKGKKCLDITRDLEIDLGNKIISREETSEMHDAEVRNETDQRVKERGKNC